MKPHYKSLDDTLKTVLSKNSAPPDSEKMEAMRRQLLAAVPDEPVTNRWWSPIRITAFASACIIVIIFSALVITNATDSTIPGNPNPLHQFEQIALDDTQLDQMLLLLADFTSDSSLISPYENSETYGFGTTDDFSLLSDVWNTDTIDL